MNSCEYNQVINKIYSIIRKNQRICKLLYYNTDVDIDDETVCPNLSSNQQREVWSKYIKKLLNIKAINDEARAYICIKVDTVDFTDPNKRNSYQPYWGKVCIFIHVICADTIEELHGNSRCMELCSEIQRDLTMSDVGAIGNAYINNITATRVVDNYTSYAIPITFVEKNSKVMNG